MPVRHVLVVDDSKSARLMLRKMLQGFGMAVDTAESGEEAIAYLLERQPDAIFLDHTMPGMDGLSALRQIKANPATAEIPVAMYTSKDEAGYREEAQAAGAMDVLIKPAIPEILGVLLERMHQKLDAAPTSAPALAASDTVNLQWVEKIITDKAESVFYDAVESQVLPLLNDVIAKLKRDIEAGQATALSTAALSEIATKACDARLAEVQQHPQWTEETLQTRLSVLLDERLEAFRRGEQDGLQQLVQDVTSQMCQSQLNELSERLIRQLSSRFTEAAQKLVVSSRDAAVEAGREAALEALSAAAVEPAPVEPAAIEAAMVTPAEPPETGHAWANLRRDLLRHIYLAAAGAAAIGIGAALLVHSLR